MSGHTVELERYHGPKTRHTCPRCKKPGQFTRYVDTKTGAYLADDVGRCNRINKCGYHKTPKEYNSEKRFETGNKKIGKMQNTTEAVIDYVPMEMVNRAMASNKESSFAKFLISLLGEAAFTILANIYLLGRSNEDGGKAAIFFQVDEERKCRTGKIMMYNEITGKRCRGQYDTPKWVHKSSKFQQPFRYQQCLFGAHLLADYPGKPVGIVESEKTAIIATAFMPELNWLATGGVTGAKWHEYAVYKSLLNKTVFLFPDYGYYNRAKEITCYDKWEEIAENIRSKSNNKIKVSSVLEDSLNEKDREQGWDLADFLIRQDSATGYAIDDNDNPLKEWVVSQQWWDMFTGLK